MHARRHPSELAAAIVVRAGCSFVVSPFEEAEQRLDCRHPPHRIRQRRIGIDADPPVSAAALAATAVPAQIDALEHGAEDRRPAGQHEDMALKGSIPLLPDR